MTEQQSVAYARFVNAKYAEGWGVVGLFTSTPPWRMQPAATPTDRERSTTMGLIPDDVIDDWATDMIRSAAAGVTAQEVRNAFGGHDDLDGLTEEEHDSVLAELLDRVHDVAPTLTID